MEGRESGVDIEHEALKRVVWIKRNESPGDNKDDDNKGFVDDIHGWNFLGDAVKENMEYTRIYKRLRSKYDGKPSSTIRTGFVVPQAANVNAILAINRGL